MKINTPKAYPIYNALQRYVDVLRDLRTHPTIGIDDLFIAPNIVIVRYLSCNSSLGNQLHPGLWFSLCHNIYLFNYLLPRENKST